MKKVSFIVLMLFAVAVVRSQNAPEADRYREQYARLGKEFSQSPDNVLNLMEMADFFSTADNPHYSLTLAAHYAARAEELYTAWVQDRKKYRDVQKLIRKGLTIPTIRQKRKEIEAEAVLYVRSHVPQMAASEASAFIEEFADNDEIVKRLQAKVLSEAFERVCQENTINGYYLFASSYPNTVEADSAERAMSRLAPGYFSQFATEQAVDDAATPYAASAAMRYAAMKQKSRLAYRDVCRKNSVEAYSDYLERYPRGDYYLEALERIQQLRNADYGILTTPDELADFAEANSDDPLADSALAKLCRIAIDEHDQRAAVTYLSRFPLDKEHSNVYRQYYEWHAEEGNGAPIASFMTAHPDYPFMMSARSDLARAAIIDSIDLTKPFAESDLDAMTTNIRLMTGCKAAFVALQRILQHQIAGKDWAGARRRLQQFDICFEDVSTSEYNELSHLLSDNVTVSSDLEVAVGSMSHAVVHPSGSTLCFAYDDQGVQSIGYARRVGGEKNGRWRYMGDIDVEGCTGTAVPYSFYDGGTKVLLGIHNDIWSAQVVSDTVWQLLEHFQSPVNSQYIEQDAYMVEDGSGMLVVSDRPGGHNVQPSGSYYHGDHAPASDIYFIPRTDTTGAVTQWGGAINLGITVNTPYCERSPILSRNMRTLYYVTDARGLGYGDIYCVTRTHLDDWTHWSKPVNMGRGVNGAFGEGSLSFGLGERRVFYTSAAHADSKSGCYSFATRHDTASCHTVVTVRLDSVFDMLRHLEWVEVNRQRVVGQLHGGEVDTALTYRIYKDILYALVADANWIYVPTLLIRANEEREAIPQAYTLGQLRAMSDPLPLPLVQFAGTTSRLLPLANKELKALSSFLRQHASAEVEIGIHVNGISADECYRMSIDRASVVRTALVSYGIDEGRIRIAPYGNVKYKKGGVDAQVTVRFL